MRERILLDTGPLVAWLDADDQWHREATGLTRGLATAFITCEPVLTEACFLLQRNPRATEQIAQWLSRGFIRLEFPLTNHAERVFHLMHQYRNLPMSLADACLVAMVETGIGDRVFTLDEHFRIYRHSGRRVVPVLMPG